MPQFYTVLMFFRVWGKKTYFNVPENKQMYFESYVYKPFFKID